jgi:bifunctional ADP-heptose synthase (sugar kinase/adenylyltransferase)
MLVIALPITPQGIGTRDVVALELLSRFAVGTPQEKTATLAAATLSWAGALTLVQATFSPLLMRQARKLFDETGAGDEVIESGPE